MSIFKETDPNKDNEVKLLDIRELIPVHKSDYERVEKLKKLSLKDINPILPDLMVWLQDQN